MKGVFTKEHQEITWLTGNRRISVVSFMWYKWTYLSFVNDEI